MPRLFIMKFKFTEDKTYNLTGANGSRVHAKKGEVHDLPPYLCQMLSQWGRIVRAEPSEQPTAGPKEIKFDFFDLPRHEKLKQAGFNSLESVSGASDEELLDVDGIGPATLKNIRGYFE